MINCARRIGCGAALLAACRILGAWGRHVSTDELSSHAVQRLEKGDHASATIEL